MLITIDLNVLWSNFLLAIPLSGLHAYVERLGSSKARGAPKWELSTKKSDYTSQLAYMDATDLLMALIYINLFHSQEGPVHKTNYMVIQLLTKKKY